VTDDEQRRARRSEALAAAREAARDDGRAVSDETDDVDHDARERGDERRGRRAERDRRQGEHERQQSGHERRQGGREQPREDAGNRDDRSRRDETPRGERRDGAGGRSESRERTRTGEQVERVSAVDHDAALVTAFEHDGYDCELGRVDDDFFGFVRVPPDHDRLHLMWELDVPGEFGYGPDADGWVGFDTSPVDRELSPREAAMALAGLAAQVAERSRSRPK
jgi:hypothetical protein